MLKPCIVIFGINPGDEYESLLVSEHAGLTDMAHAERVKAWLESEGCKDCRIHSDKGEPPKFGANLLNI